MSSSSSGSGGIGNPGDEDDRAIDARSVVTLVVFLVVNALVLFPLRMPLPLRLPRVYRRLLSREPNVKGRSELRCSGTTPSSKGHAGTSPADPSTRAVKEDHHHHRRRRRRRDRGRDGDGMQNESHDGAQSGDPQRWYLSLGLETAPVLGVLLLLASTCIPGSVVRDGIVGSGGVRPYDIMTLFVSFAYISLSLDSTGLLRFLAFFVASRTSTSGRILYTSFFLFWALAGLLVGNDPLILSGTPFLAYLADHASFSPPTATAFLFTQFQTANLVSALLVSSNPTNLVLTQAFGVSFLGYSAWLALPTLAGVAVLYPLLRFGVFGGGGSGGGEGMIPRTISAPTVHPRSALKDPVGAVLGATVFLVTIGLLVGLSAGGKLEGVEGVWTVTAPAAIVVFLRDCAFDLCARGGQGAADDCRATGRASGDGEKPEPDQEDTRKECLSGPVAQGDVERCSDTAVKEDAKRRLRVILGSEETGSQETMLPSAGIEEDKTSEVSARPREVASEGGTVDRYFEADRPTVPIAVEATEPPTARTTRTSVDETTQYRSGHVGEAVSPTARPPTSMKTPSSVTPPRPAAPSAQRHSTCSGPASPAASRGKTDPVLRFVDPITRKFPTASRIVARLPLPLVPFAFSMFILVEALQYTRWIGVWAGWWAAWERVGGVAGSVWLMGMLGVLGCNIFGTNIGATVLLSREWSATLGVRIAEERDEVENLGVLQQWQASTPDVSQRSLYGAVFALAVGSNLGAYSFVFPASLAGLLWRNILAQKGLTVRRRDFVRWNTLPLVVTMLAGCLVVAGEVCVMYRN